MSFSKAVAAVPDLAKKLRQGKQALGAHSVHVDCDEEARITGSIDVDDALRSHASHAQASRWDYGVGYREPRGAKESAIWVEVHSAHTGEVRAMLNKLSWLKDFLVAECPALWAMTAQAKGESSPFVWIAPKGVHILRNSPQARQLAQSALRWPTKRLKLP